MYICIYQKIFVPLHIDKGSTFDYSEPTLQVEPIKILKIMKELNGIKYTEYGTMEGGDFTATVRVKVNPYLSGVFVRVVKENHREICCGAYDKGNGIIDIDFIDVYPFNVLLDEISKLTDIKYEFVEPKED